MAFTTRGKARRAAILFAVLAAALVLPLLLTGCGPQTPEAAVRSFYTAIQNRDWDGYLSAILPSNVRRATDADLASQKKKFMANDYKYLGLKLKTTPDKKDPNKAAVELTSGVVRGKNPQTGQVESTTIAQIKKQYGVTPTLSTEKYKGCWYIDVPIAAADQPTQQQ